MGTHGYLAPEVIILGGTGEDYDPFKADVFALAVVALILFHKVHPWGYHDQEKTKPTKPRDAVEYVQGEEGEEFAENEKYTHCMDTWSKK